MAELLSPTQEKNLFKLLDNFFVTYEPKDLSYKTRVFFGKKFVPLGSTLRSITSSSKISDKQKDRILEVLKGYGVTPETLRENTERAITQGSTPDLVVATEPGKAEKLKKDLQNEQPKTKNGEARSISSRTLSGAVDSYVSWASKIGSHGIFDAVRKIKHSQDQGLPIPDVVHINTTQIPSSRLIEVLQLLHRAGKIDRNFQPNDALKEKIQRKVRNQSSSALTLDRALLRSTRR